MNPTALDILNKHFEEAKRNHPEKNWVDDIAKRPIETGLVLAAMREIAEMMFASGVDSVLDDGPGLEARLKQLFPEK